MTLAGRHDAVDESQRTEYTPLMAAAELFSSENGSDPEQQQNRRRTANDDDDDDDATTGTGSTALLAFFVIFALIEGSIQVKFEIWWAVGMNALIAATGIASLAVGHRGATTTVRARADVIVHLVTLATWTVSAIVGSALFGIFVVRNGRENLMALCLASTGQVRASSYRSVPLGVCAEYSVDGTFRRIWVTAILAGFLLGFPFMYLAVRTTYRFYRYAAAAAAAKTETRKKPPDRP